jgi:6-phosphogluconolactonase
MQRPTIMMAVCLALTSLAAHARDEPASLVYIGTRGTSPAPTAAVPTPAPQGIYAARLDSRSGKLEPLGLQLELMRVSWLVAHPSLPVIFLVANPEGSAPADSSIRSFAVDNASGKLQPINQVDSGGRDTTHLNFDTKSNTLFGASFGSGDVTASPVLRDGSVGKVASSQKEYGTGPHPRQSAPHVHAIAVDLTHRYVLSADMGADRIFVYRFDSSTRALMAAATPFEALPPGSGPRHLAFHPNGKFLYVNTELTAEVRVYGWDAKQGRLHFIEALPAYPAGYAGKDRSSAEIVMSGTGRFIYVSLRGDQDSIVAFNVNGKTGRLKELQRISSQGKSPRSFGIDPTGRWMLVMNEATNSVNVLGIDRATGKLSATSESVSIPNPAMVAFHRN